MRKSRHLLLVSLLLFTACSGQAAHTVDDERTGTATLDGRTELAPGKWVTDAANVLDDEIEASLTNQLAELEQKTGHQMVVVTVPTLGGQKVEEYTVRLARQWAVGRRDYDDGVVLLLAPAERKARIEVGLGLEQVVTDSFAATVLERDMIPKFRRGDYDGGVATGVATLIDHLSRSN